MKTQLDVSIVSADKALNTASKISDFINKEVTVEHKTDGVKLTVIKKSNNGNIDDYIFAYKGNILFKDEYDYQPNSRAEKSIGCSQFKKVFQHFEKLGTNDIPVGTELFIEFLMKKPTLSSNYTDLHKMVLIGYSTSEYEVNFGKLMTTNNGLQTLHRKSYAEMMQIDVPKILFRGFFIKESFIDGIKSSQLMDLFLDIEDQIEWNNSQKMMHQIKELFLGVDSRYGGKEEGVVLISDDIMYKWQQDYQLDQNARFLIKQKYREDDNALESLYWNNVKNVASSIIENVHLHENINYNLMQLSDKLKSLQLDFNHSKKPDFVIKDDIQLNAKSLIIKRTPGNNNALIIGKFRVLTNDGHVKLIKDALKRFDDVMICLVTSKDTKSSKHLRESMLLHTFPNVKLMHSTNANLIRLINQSCININSVYCGSDRIKGYQEQLKNTVGVSVLELERSENDISASKVIDKIDDKSFFLSNTPETIHGFYDDIIRIWGEDG